MKPTHDMTAGTGPDIYVLDIDGTLIRTHEIDNECYWQAIHRVYGIDSHVEDLVSFEHVSDSGILDEWSRRFVGRAPFEDEITAIRGLFLESMQSAAEQRPELFQPRPGLEPWLEAVIGECGTHLAIATGSWENTARFKLQVSGLARFELTLASADDAVSRTDIMNVAVSRLGLPRATANHRITYVGDGPWDLKASSDLGWSFIGIAEGDRAQALLDLGAEHVDGDFWPLAGYHGIVEG